MCALIKTSSHYSNMKVFLYIHLHPTCPIFIISEIVQNGHQMHRRTLAPGNSHWSRLCWGVQHLERSFELLSGWRIAGDPSLGFFHHRHGPSWPPRKRSPKVTNLVFWETKDDFKSDLSTQPVSPKVSLIFIIANLDGISARLTPIFPHFPSESPTW